MSKNTDGQTSNDNLTRWWWPGQWLKIVYSIWFDQLWYWNNVRPQLVGRLFGWEIFIQVLLGSALLLSILTGIFGLILQILRISFDWGGVFIGPALALAGSSLISVTIGGVKGVNWGTVFCATASFGLGIILSLLVNIPLSTIMTPKIAVIFYVLVSAILATTIGVFSGVVNGEGLEMQRAFTFAGIVIIYMTIVSIVNEIEYGISGGLLIGLSFTIFSYLSNRWISRQVPDKRVRKTLTKPDNN